MSHMFVETFHLLLINNKIYCKTHNDTHLLYLMCFQIIAHEDSGHSWNSKCCSSTRDKSFVFLKATSTVGKMSKSVHTLMKHILNLLL